MNNNKAIIDQINKTKKWISSQIENFNEFKNETIIMIKTLVTNEKKPYDISIKEKIESVSTNCPSNSAYKSNELNLNLNLNFILNQNQNKYKESAQSNLRNLNQNKEFIKTESADQSNYSKEFIKIIFQSDINKLEEKINECDRKIMELVKENYKEVNLLRIKTCIND